MQDSSPEEDHGENAPALTVEKAIANLQHEDVSLRYYAAWWLGRFRVRESAAIDALIAALADEDYRTQMGDYPLRRNAARALGKLGDQRAVPKLIHCLECSDYYVREAAAQSLEMLRAATAVPALMQLLVGGLAAAQQVPDRPHLTQPYEAVIEALGTLQATEAVALIQPFLEHPVARVQYAAIRAMYQFTQDDTYAQRLVQALKGDDLKLRRVALSDLGAIGYLPAAGAIANTSAENSFKLLALKGLLEHQVKNEAQRLTDEAIRVMSLMDSLL